MRPGAQHSSRLSKRDEVMSQYSQRSQLSRASSTRIKKIDSSINLSALRVPHKDQPTIKLLDQLPQWEDIKDSILSRSKATSENFAYQEDVEAKSLRRAGGNKVGGVEGIFEEPEDIDLD